MCVFFFKKETVGKIIFITVNKSSYTNKRSEDPTVFRWRLHWLLFKVLCRDIEPKCFLETLTNSTKHCLD